MPPRFRVICVGSREGLRRARPEAQLRNFPQVLLEIIGQFDHGGGPLVTRGEY